MYLSIIDVPNIYTIIVEQQKLEVSPTWRKSDLLNPASVCGVGSDKILQ